MIFLTMAFAVLVKVAVIDTGYNKEQNEFTQCSDMGKDLTGTGMQDLSNHGDHISHILEYKTKYPSKYCQAVIKYVDAKNPVSSLLSVENSIKAFEYVYENRKQIKLINYSSSGFEKVSTQELEEYIQDKRKSLPISKPYLRLLLKERLIIKELLNEGVKIVVAAGNEGREIKDNYCNVFPACHDDRIIVVGYKHSPEFKSNYGKFVDYYEDGYKIKTLSGEITGSSAAAAIRSAKELDTLIEKEMEN
jgi:hypothetical protein